MKDLILVIGISAAVLHAVAYILYNLQTKRNQSKPNVASWSIWAFLAILNAFSFHKMSGNALLTLQFFTASVACALTFAHALISGKFAWPKFLEWICLSLGLIAALVWWKFQNATGANMIVIVALIISFIPTWQGVLNDPFIEMPHAWVIWTAAYCLTTLNIVIKDGETILLFAPIARIISHGLVAVLSAKKRKKQFAALKGGDV
ncbi:MAG: hypothetical protein V1867_00055 [Candidatus Falkowbacteria bacterium]